jgi:hypothetical protein
MALSADIDATTPKYLRDKYAIVGVGDFPAYPSQGHHQ